MSLSTLTTRSRVLAVGVLCAAGGASAGAVATATASTGTSHAKAHHAQKGKHAKGLRRLDRRAVQGSIVVHTKSGFQTVSFERGKVDSVSGDQLTLTEGTAKDAYKTVTLTIPSNARVRDNGQTASLSSVTAGQHVLVAQLPKRTIVRAHTPGQRKAAQQ